MQVVAGSRDLLLNSATAYISQLQSPACAMCAVQSMQPLRNYSGLLFTSLPVCNCCMQLVFFPSTVACFSVQPDLTLMSKMTVVIFSSVNCDIV